jgi:glutaryl-CoA dehydrogenase (non-decarboxylating)
MISLDLSEEPVIYEDTREIHKLMQADVGYALGYRRDKPRRVGLPAFQK